MKATEQYFPVVLFTMLNKVVLIFKHVSLNPKESIQQHFSAVLFIIPIKSFNVKAA